MCHFLEKNIDMLYIFGFTGSLAFQKYVTLNGIFFIFGDTAKKRLKNEVKITILLKKNIIHYLHYVQ